MKRIPFCRKWIYTVEYYNSFGSYVLTNAAALKASSSFFHPAWGKPRNVVLLHPTLHFPLPLPFSVTGMMNYDALYVWHHGSMERKGVRGEERKYSTHSQDLKGIVVYLWVDILGD